MFWIFWLATSLNGGRSVFKMGLRLQAFTGLAFVAALAWGWYECPSRSTVQGRESGMAES